MGADVSPPVRRSWKRWIWPAGWTILALLLLAALLPTLLATSLGKRFLASRIAKSLGMPVSIGELSCGWRSPTEIRQCKLGPSPEGLSVSIPRFQANFTVWEWVWSGDELRIEILEPEIEVRLAKPKDKTPVEQKPIVEQPAVLPPREEEKSSPLPFRKAQIAVKEASFFFAQEGSETRAESAFDFQASFTSESREGKFQLAWTKLSLAAVEPLLARVAPGLSLRGQAQVTIRGGLNAAGVGVSAKAVVENLQMKGPSFSSPWEEPRLELETGECRANLLLGTFETKGFRLRAPSLGASLEGELEARDRFRECKTDLRFQVLVDRLAPLFAASWPEGLPREGPLAGRIEAEFPRRHPERVRADLTAEWKPAGKSWRAKGSFDGRGEELVFSAQAQIDATEIRPSFLPVLAYPIPFLASKDTHLLRMESTVEGEIRLEGRGKDWESCKRSLRGEGKLRLSSGSLAGPSALSQILDSSRGGALRFERIEAPFRIAEGAITTPGVEWQASETRIVISGTTTFDGALDYAVELDLPAKARGKSGAEAFEKIFGKQGLPVRLIGTIENPRLEFRKPDWEEAGQTLLEEGLEALKNRKKK